MFDSVLQELARFLLPEAALDGAGDLPGWIGVVPKRGVFVGPGGLLGGVYQSLTKDLIRCVFIAGFEGHPEGWLVGARVVWVVKEVGVHAVG